MNSFRLFKTPALLLTVSLPMLAAAQDASTALHLRTLAAACASCHGSDGKVADGSSIPALAGMPREAMVAALTGFKNGSRPATVMHQLSKGLSDAQIGQLATYFAAVR